MKKWIAYLFLLVYLSSFTEMRQLTKLPNLVEHYISHQLLNSDMTFAAFFKMHYIDDQLLDSDYKQDMKLPFKTHDFSIVGINLSIPPEASALDLLRQPIYVDYSGNFSYSEKFYPSVFSKIWEPPKI